MAVEVGIHATVADNRATRCFRFNCRKVSFGGRCGSWNNIYIMIHALLYCSQTMDGVLSLDPRITQASVTILSPWTPVVIYLTLVVTPGMHYAEIIACKTCENG